MLDVKMTDRADIPPPPQHCVYCGHENNKVHILEWIDYPFIQGWFWECPNFYRRILAA